MIALNLVDPENELASRCGVLGRPGGDSDDDYSWIANPGLRRLNRRLTPG